jgi:hypothetical protein
MELGTAAWEEVTRGQRTNNNNPTKKTLAGMIQRPRFPSRHHLRLGLLEIVRHARVARVIVVDKSRRWMCPSVDEQRETSSSFSVCFFLGFFLLSFSFFCGSRVGRLPFAAPPPGISSSFFRASLDVSRLVPCLSVWINGFACDLLMRMPRRREDIGFRRRLPSASSRLGAVAAAKLKSCKFRFIMTDWLALHRSSFIFFILWGPLWLSFIFHLSLGHFWAGKREAATSDQPRGRLSTCCARRFVRGAYRPGETQRAKKNEREKETY